MEGEAFVGEAEDGSGERMWASSAARSARRSFASDCRKERQ